MKKILLIAAIFITLSTKAQTSVYHPFPDSSAIWNFHFSVPFCPPGSIDSYYSFTLTGDTIINSQTYHKLEIPFVQSIALGSCTPSIFSGYKGAIRQDTAMRKVFIVPPTTTIEELLYDFNMQVGDTVRGYIEPFFFPDAIDAIDSVLIGNSYHKRWIIDPWAQIYLIEGVGSTYGLIESIPGGLIDAPLDTLTCFMQNGQPLLPDTTTTCELITGFENIYIDNSLVLVSPNPFSNLLSFTSNSHEILEVNLYDIASKKLINQKFTHSISLNTQQLATGIYLYEIRSKDGSFSKGKVLKN